MTEFARCVARTSPQEVHGLLATTQLGTREEHEAIMRLVPSLQRCLPSARNLRLAAPLVRLALADALYDRARRAQAR